MAAAPANRLARTSSMPDLPATESPGSSVRPDSKSASALESVHTLCGRAAEARAEQIELLEPRLHLLIRNGELERRVLNEIAPPAAIDPEAAEPRVRRFHALLVFHCFHQCAACHGPIPLGNLRHA